jgi:hypothetical protein
VVDGLLTRFFFDDSLEAGVWCSHAKKIQEVVMKRAAGVLAVIVLLVLPAASIAGEHFDGTWHTKIVCPPKGDTQGFTWNMDSVIKDGNLRAERRTAGEPGYFLLEGKVGENGKAKLTGSGIINSRAYARGVFAHKGESYTWDVKAEFKDTEGTGLRNEGLGIVGRPCTFDFVKAPASPEQTPPAAPAAQ